MILFNQVKNAVSTTVRKLQAEGVLPADVDMSGIVTEVPPTTKFGDYATNAAMYIAKKARKNPREMAESLRAELTKNPLIKTVDIAGPGFINMRIEDKAWDMVLKSVLSEREKYGTSNIGRKQKINVEFLSANPTGPMHVGHSRGAIYGDVVARLLENAGYNVTREYYINDYGKQVEALASSVYWRYEELFGLHKNESIPEGQYPGDYVITIAKKIQKKYGDFWLGKPKDDWMDLFKTIAVDSMMKMIRSDLKKLGIDFDVYTSEKKLVKNGKVRLVLNKLMKKNLLYHGATQKPIGEEVGEWSPEPQLLFKSTKFGDVSDRVIARPNGDTTYFASDIAYHLDKYQRGYKKQIDIWGADHGGYVARMQAALNAVTNNDASLDVSLCQIVNLLKDGKPFRMSKRAGNFVLVSDILKEIDVDAFRIFVLSRSADTQMSFDLARTKEQSKDNPVFYIKYALGRIHSLMKNYNKTFQTDPVCKVKDIYKNASEPERDIIRKIAAYPVVVATAARTKSPHLIVTYLDDLSQKFHSLWTYGAKNGEKFIDPANKEKTDMRILIARSVGQTLTNGLLCLNVSPQRLINRDRTKALLQKMSVKSSIR